MTFTFYGQSCFLIQAGGHSILFDPFITQNPLAKGVDISAIKADFIFVTHGHGDHVADLETLANQTEATVVCSPEIGSWLSKKGLKKLHPLNHGGWVIFPFGKARAVNAIHSSGLPDGSYGGNPLGFVFTTGDGDFYIAGDTALTLDMQLIPYWTKKLAFSAFPIGGNYTMDVADAIVATDFVKCNTVVATHYNTFPPITIDIEGARRDFEAAGKKLLTPAVGETIEI